MVARASTSRSRPFAAAIHELAIRTDAAVLLDLENTVLFTNEAWERFARECGGFGEAAVGSHLLDAVAEGEPRDVLAQVLARVAHGPGPRARTFTVECNGPDLARLVTMQVSPVLAGGEPVGLVIVQKVVRELPVGEVYQVVAATAEEYRAPDGSLEQCSCCRRTRRPADPAEWDFVPALVAAPPDQTVYRYCPLCHELHNPLAGEEER
jgi:hypothetical protein